MPGFGTRVLAFFLKFVPKVGPFKALDFKIPTRKTEDLYIASVNHTLDNYKGLLVEVRADKLHLANTDFDTGRMTHAGEYILTDNAYAHLLDQLAKHNFDQVTPELRQNILAFYERPECSDRHQTKHQRLGKNAGGGRAIESCCSNANSGHRSDHAAVNKKTFGNVLALGPIAFSPQP